MVQAILEGRKSQTRRIVKIPYAEHVHSFRSDHNDENERWIGMDGNVQISPWAKCPYGQPGDVLYVRESHYRYGHWNKNGTTKTGKQKWKFIPATNLPSCRFMDDPPNEIEKNSYRKIGWYKRPGIFLPKELSRIHLKVENVRVERLQDISEDDARSEGVKYDIESGYYFIGDEIMEQTATDCFIKLWDKINGTRAPWESNPWVWVVEFSRIENYHPQ